jgi:hypothetical protein
MAILETPIDVTKLTEESASPEVLKTFDEMCRKVPQGSLAEGLTHAFHSNQTPPFGEMFSRLFLHSSPDQKAGVLNRIVSHMGPAGLAEAIAASGNPSTLAKIFAAGGGITPAQAQQITPEQIRALAENAAKKNPTLVNAVSDFYARHPGVVKAIGAGALAFIISKVKALKG